VSTPSRGLWLDDCCENPRRKKLVAFGADEPDSSEPAKGLKEGVFQMRGEGCGWVREGGGNGLVCISVLRVCFGMSVSIGKGGMKCTLVVCSI